MAIGLQGTHLMIYGHLADAAMKRVQRVVNCYFDMSSDDISQDIDNEENNAQLLNEENSVISFPSIFEQTESNVKSDRKGETTKGFLELTDDRQEISSPDEVEKAKTSEDKSATAAAVVITEN